MVYVAESIHRGTHAIGKMAEKKSLSRKTQGIWKFCQNTRNLVCSSCNFPDSKGNNVSIFAAKISIFRRSWIRQFCVCNSHKSRKLSQGKFTVRQEKYREFENAI